MFLPQWKTTILPPDVILSSKSNQFCSREEVRIYPVRLLNCSTIGVGFNGVEIILLMNSHGLSDTSSSLIICSLYMLSVAVQFYPWFDFYFPLFQTHCHALPYPKTKENKI